jgi:hypothetical protein
MSSVSRYVRQIPVTTTYYSAQDVANTSNGYIFEFVPSSSNYVGNYPTGFNNPTGGYVVPAGQALEDAVDEIVNKYGIDSLVLRDMGKTIFAPVPATLPGPATTTDAWTYFRQVQLITPNVISQGPGFMGGTNGSTFGVLGAAQTPDPYTNYLTFYIPVSVAGVGIGGSVIGAFAVAGGQM